MKLDRMLGILTLLLQKERMTAPELAGIFEVSKRTIYRDIDALSMAGIPLVTYPGGEGGISIAEGYKLDKQVLSHSDVDALSAALEGLKSISENSAQIDGLLRKLTPASGVAREGKHEAPTGLRIDLASYYKNSLSTKIALLRQAIKDQRPVAFDYYSESGESKRCIEPHVVTYRWSAWYVVGYCWEKQGFRTFKLNRLWELETLDGHFVPKPIPEEKQQPSDIHPDDHVLVVDFDASVKYKLIEDYGPRSFIDLGGGKLRFTGGYTNESYIMGWVMSFGDKAKVIKPQSLADEIKERAKKMVLAYERDI